MKIVNFFISVCFLFSFSMSTNALYLQADASASGGGFGDSCADVQSVAGEVSCTASRVGVNSNNNETFDASGTGIVDSFTGTLTVFGDITGPGSARSNARIDERLFLSFDSGVTSGQLTVSLDINGGSSSNNSQVFLSQNGENELWELGLSVNNIFSITTNVSSSMSSGNVVDIIAIINGLGFESDFYNFTGVLSIEASEGVQWSPQSSGFLTVPIPPTLWLLGSALIGLLSLNRKSLYYK